MKIYVPFYCDRWGNGKVYLGAFSSIDSAEKRIARDIENRFNYSSEEMNYRECIEYRNKWYDILEDEVRNA